MNRLELVDEILQGKGNRLRESYFNKNYPDILDEILLYCSNISHLPFNQKIWHWVNKKPSEYLCKCGNNTTFNRNWKDGYRKYCSAKCSASDSSTKEKRKSTNLKKYGVDNVAKLDDVKKKQEETNLAKYGHKSSFQNKEVRKKWKKVIKEKYSVDHVFQLVQVKEKSKKTNLSKFGKEHFVQSEFYKQKLEEIGFSEILKKIYFHNHIEKYIDYNLEFKEINDRILTLKSNSCGHEFKIHYDSIKRRLENGYEYCTVCNPINSGQSQEEIVIVKWLKGIQLDLIERDRSLGIELDIYIPSKKLAIEFNGLYWHSELYKNKNFHLNKTKICQDNDIQLIHIWEDDWLYKTEIIKSIISNRLGIIQKRIFARKCQIKIVKNSEKDDFLENNHIQGKCVSSINLGLFHDDEMVSLMTFGKRSINGKEEFELLRFCNKIDNVIVGSASKLFKYFVENFNFESITSFADISQFGGGLYKKLGFEYIHRSEPNYWWIVDGIRHHRFNYNKKRLVKEGFDSSKTEVEIMYSRGYFRVFGCGQDKYVYKKR